MRLLLSLLLLSMSPRLLLAVEPDTQFFENQIRPLLVEHCYECHSRESDTSEGGLFLDSKRGWAEGGDSGPAIHPGDPDRSLVMEAVLYKNVDLQMPPEGKLSPDEIEALRTWIDAGAADPRSEDSAPAASDPADAFDLVRRVEQHWCWQPITNATPPRVESAWAKQDVDAFVWDTLVEHQLHPAPPADKRTFLRRATFALIGLPPAVNEIRDYVSDQSDEAEARVIDRLLESPHFGEKWGQHWLDLMRYAETRGHEQDFAIPEAYRYRDYVIHAFNEDVPYDQFVKEHLAGDLMPHPRLDPQDHSNQSIQGTGFWQLHDATHSPVDIRGDEALRMQNQIDVFSKAFLGLSLGCARCHDHKFDALSMRDYYAMYGYLQSSSYYLADVSDPEQQAAAATRVDALNQQQQARLRHLLAAKIRQQSAALTDYLEAVAELDAEVLRSAGEEVPAQAQTLSRERSIDAETLWRLGQYLHGEVPLNSPLKASSMQLQSPDSDAWPEHEKQLANQIDKATAAWQQLQVVRSEKDGERNYKASRRPWTPDDIIADYTNAKFPHWITAGHRWGSGPVNVGEMILGTQADRPVAWFADQACASSQQFSDKFTGLLRTRTFEVVADQIWYRYRGTGKVFLAVDSHRVVAGPLHGVVKRDLKSDDHQWHWFSQNVRDYIGHRVHVEFTGGPNFAVDKVLFAGGRPPDDIPYPPAKPVDKLLTSVADRLEQGNLDASDAWVLNWWLDHQALLPPTSDTEIANVVADFASRRKAIETTIPQPVYALTLLDGSGENEPVHIRGNHRNREEQPVARDVLSALGQIDQTDVKGSGRWQLAEKLTDPSNPLLARVYVNRIWHHLFGRGIVETVDDFGVMGKAPTHPELLDYLAYQFVQNGWSTKWLIRELMLTNTYRMSSRPDSEQDARDPNNLFLHRMPVRRLTGEVIRDHLLTVSGRLEPTLFGPSVKVHITPFMRGNRTPKTSGPVDGGGRRSIYTEVRRNHLPAFLAAFDKPPPFMAMGKRTISNSPTQSLILLNDPLVHELALLWAQNLLQFNGTDDDRIAYAFEQAFARLPSADERTMALGFLQQQEASYDRDAQTLAWRDLCHTLFNVKEFIHVN